MNRTVSQDFIERCADAYARDPFNAVRQNAVTNGGLQQSALNRREDILNPMTFSVEIKTGKVTDQKRSGRCWLFAGLNALRLAVMRNLNLETFELSQCYQMFWDKLEKANYFLESVFETLNEPLDGRLMAHLLADPIQDAGQWDMFCALVDKYGCVPKDMMPETFHSSDSAAMNKLLTAKLREDAMILREAHEAGRDEGDLRARKEEMLSDIYRMLRICLGEPPAAFDFSVRDRAGRFVEARGITPRQFFGRYVGRALDEYVPLINAPTADKPYGRTFTVAYLGNVVGGRPVKFLNLPIEALKRAAIAQLQGGEPVWFGCDVGKMQMRERGVLGMEAFNYEALLGVTFGLDKAQRLDYGESILTHAMVLLGVHLVDEKPVRWKVENSWSDKRGQDGYYVMTDAWFDQYNYEVVVNKKYLTDEERAQYGQAPIALKPWDPMGSLA